MSDISVEVEGLDALIRKTSSELLTQPLTVFFTQSGLTVRNKAQALSPVDTGRLKNSIAHDLDTSSPPLWVKIGTNVNYGKAMEFGTGTQSDAPDSGGGRHFPPPAALDTWARRHGFPNGYIVARAIARKGGLKPRSYLRDGFEESQPQIMTFLEQAAANIEKAWGE